MKWTPSPRVAGLLLLLAVAGTRSEVIAQPPDPFAVSDTPARGRGIAGRRILYQTNATPELKSILGRLLQPSTEWIRDADMPGRSRFFLRLTEARFIVDGEGHLQPEARLDGNPFVFLTVPEAAYGRTLYQLYSDLGYSAESVLRQRDVPMVALILRYPTEVRVPDPWEGPSGKDWDSRVYQPTWETVFDLFARLASETRQGKYVRFPDLTAHERALAQFLPAARRQAVATLPYPLLRVAGGPDWEYRSLLEAHLSINAHFRGTGFTEKTLSPGDGRLGLPEFVGPNMELGRLAEFAVVDLGYLEFEEAHRKP
jgi:hypothetical protein